jgi:p-hydroxybenzoate 3-monooxygenase
MDASSTQVGVLGAGPAGLILALLLEREGIDAVVLEVRDRAYVEGRVRAGLLEQSTVNLLCELGAGKRLLSEGFRQPTFEVCFGGDRHKIPIAELTDGHETWIYGQQEIVKDLLAELDRRDRPPLFEVSEVELEGIEGDRPAIRFRHGNRNHRLACDVVAGCDGSHGVSRQALPASVARSFFRVFPFAWLGILVDAPPATIENLIYAHHPDGFALHSFRSHEVSRMYLQVPPDTDMLSWNDARIWRELRRRFGSEDGWEPNEGPIRHRSLTAMRSFVTEPMRAGSLVLAGDAAHIVPPTAAKGLNLAVADVRLLANALADRLLHGDESALDAYSNTALRRVWQVQAFSEEMTNMFHHLPGDGMSLRLQEAKLERLVSSPIYTKAFCEAYAGAAFTGLEAERMSVFANDRKAA